VDKATETPVAVVVRKAAIRRINLLRKTEINLRGIANLKAKEIISREIEITSKEETEINLKVTETGHHRATETNLKIKARRHHLPIPTTNKLNRNLINGQ
jgi:hypothetical protein